MLQQLHIQNYAIIDSLEIGFQNGLNIITGETGAGKSILMGALSLILGERVDSSTVLNKEKKCVVEGFFTVDGKKAVMDFLVENELDQENELVIRREFGSNGKSRAFVNDTPVTLGQLQVLCGSLVDLHRQFDTLELGSAGFQLEVVDAMAGTAKELAAYRSAFLHWQQEQQSFRHLQETQERNNKELDYNRFLFEELESAGLQENLLETADGELQLLNNAEGIKSVLTNLNGQLREQETPVLQVIRQLIQQLNAFAGQYPPIAALVARLQSTQIELDDIAAEAEIIGDRIGYDPKKAAALQDQLNIGYRLLKKHGVRTTNELIAIREALSGKLFAVQSAEDELKRLEKSVMLCREEMEKKAAVLTTLRKGQLVPLEKAVNKLLVRVGMPNALLKVEMASVNANDTGMDAVEFLFDANKSGQFSSLKKVASGGELSRLMLSIKSLVAGKIDLPTLIFDEIDTGISGEAGRQVGQILKELAVSRQIICITHLPQIAGRADRHLFVYKDAKGKQVRTQIRPLDTSERIQAIAEMLGGEKPSAAAIENAKEMIQST